MRFLLLATLACIAASVSAESTPPRSRRSSYNAPSEKPPFDKKDCLYEFDTFGRTGLDAKHKAFATKTWQATAAYKVVHLDLINCLEILPHSDTNSAYGSANVKRCFKDILRKLIPRDSLHPESSEGTFKDAYKIRHARRLSQSSKGGEYSEGATMFLKELVREAAKKETPMTTLLNLLRTFADRGTVNAKEIISLRDVISGIFETKFKEFELDPFYVNQKKKIEERNAFDDIEEKKIGRECQMERRRDELKKIQKDIEKHIAKKGTEPKDMLMDWRYDADIKSMHLFMITWKSTMNKLESEASKR